MRDSWAGISTNNGNTFAGGVAIDQQNWMLMACPSSGPDGEIIGDTLYSVFMNGSSGMSRVYYSKASIPAMSSLGGVAVTPPAASVTGQNYPRIGTNGSALGIVWNQTGSGTEQCMLRFTNSIANGLPAATIVVAQDSIAKADIAISNQQVIVV